MLSWPRAQVLFCALLYSALNTYREQQEARGRRVSIKRRDGSAFIFTVPWTCPGCNPVLQHCKIGYLSKGCVEIYWHHFLHLYVNLNCLQNEHIFQQEVSIIM